eukprot:GCRY01003492.1.p1 GENE.GCRY01003492.1~~GCRY01003492.1.p1  ORF type:complete len:184 (-),score=23.12 GCRY01003492.1:278-829(-)
MKISIIAAAFEDSFGIGANGRLPWNIPKEYQYFLKTIQKDTSANTKNVCIFGRKSYMLMDVRHPNIINVVLSRNPNLKEELSQDDGVIISSSLPKALAAIKDLPFAISHVWVCGGQAVYEEALTLPELDAIYLTKISLRDNKPSPPCSVFFPSFSEQEFPLASHSPLFFSGPYQYQCVAPAIF